MWARYCEPIISKFIDVCIYRASFAMYSCLLYLTAFNMLKMTNLQCVCLQAMDVEIEHSSSMDLSKYSAMFILKAREGQNLTQTALSSILTDVTELFDARLQAASHSTVRLLRESGVDDAVVSAVESNIFASVAHFRG